MMDRDQHIRAVTRDLSFRIADGFSSEEPILDAYDSAMDNVLNLRLAIDKLVTPQASAESESKKVPHRPSDCGWFCTHGATE